VNEAIAKHGKDYLPESFDLNKYLKPDWKPEQPKLWTTTKGFNCY